MAHMQNNASSSPISYWRKPLWLMGFAIYSLATGGNSSALAFAAAAIITPLGSVSLGVNALLAPVFLREQFGKYDMIGTVLIVVGTAISVVFGYHGDAEYDVRQLETLYFHLPFLIFFSLLLGCILLTFVFTKFVEERMAALASGRPISYSNILFKIIPDFRNISPYRTLGDPAGEMTSGYFDSADPEILTPRTREVVEKKRPLNSGLAFACTALASMLSTIGQLMMKSGAELVSKSISGTNEFKSFFPFAILGVLIASLFGEVIWLQRALQKFDALFVVPIFQVLLTILTVISTSLYFDQFAKFTITQAILFPLGIFITLGGTMCFVLRGSTMPTKEIREEQGLWNGSEDAFTIFRPTQGQFVGGNRSMYTTPFDAQERGRLLSSPEQSVNYSQHESDESRFL